MSNDFVYYNLSIAFVNDGGLPWGIYEKETLWKQLSSYLHDKWDPVGIPKRLRF